MKVEIKMRTLQRVDGNEELLLHEARGILRYRGETILVSYLMDGIHHEMLIDRNEPSLSIIRNWRQDRVLCYREGLKHQIMYDTPVGDMELCFDTRRLLFKLPEGDDEGVMMELSYTVYQYKSPIMDCELRIEISPLK